MTVRAALRSGVGLLTAFVPESLVASFAATVPEAMWVGWPETVEGGLALEGAHLLDEKLGRATALVIGPGLGREKETHTWLKDFVGRTSLPLVLDADALQLETVRACRGKRPILTPHAGEFERVSSGADWVGFAREHTAVVVLKGAHTRVTDGTRINHSLAGGPVLSRGGSGDLLAGIIAGLLAQNPDDPFRAANQGVIWQGLAADAWARADGAAATHTTRLLDYLSPALREVL